MKRAMMLCLAVLVITVFLGCEAIVTTKAAPPKDGGVGYLTENPEGIRVYPTRVYLIVTNEGYTIEYWPDYRQAYDIKPRVYLSKNDFKIQIKNGQVESLNSNTDTTDIAKTVIETIPKVMVPISGEIKKAGEPTRAVSIGLKPGVYRLEDDGKFHVVEIVPVK